MKKIVFIVAIIVYLNCLANKFTYDDHSYIENNPFLSSIKGVAYVAFEPIKPGEIHRGHLYRPVSLFVGYLIGKLFGITPISFHSFNILFHAINSVLMFILLEKFNLGRRTVFIAALLFAIHPIHTEAVASAVGMTELLAFLFVTVGAIMLFQRNKIYASFAPVFLFLSFLSKETSIVFLVFYIFVIFYIGFKDKEDKLFRLKLAGSLFIPLIIYFILRMHVMGQFLHAKQVQFSFVDNPLINEGLWSRIITGVYIFLYYFILFFYPVRLSADYSYQSIEVIRSVMDWRVIIIIVFMMAGIILSRYALRKKMFIELSGIIFFFITLMPVSNIFFISGAMMGERFMYLPSMGLCLFIANVLNRLAFNGGMRLKVLNVVLILIGLMLAIMTVARNNEWRDDKRLFRAVLKVVPNNVKANYNLGVLLMKEGDYKEAEGYFKKAISIYPKYYDAYMGLAFMHYYKGEWSEAITEVKKALSVFKRNEEAYALLAELYMKIGKREKAIETYIDGINNLEASFVLNYKVGLEFFKEEKWEIAEQHFKAAANVSDMPELHYYLGRCYLYMGNKEKARMEFEKCFTIYKEKPEIIKFLAFLYLEKGEFIKAKELSISYINEFPQDAEGFALAAKIYLEAFNDYNKAREYIQIAYNMNNKICQSPPFVRVCLEAFN